MDCTSDSSLARNRMPTSLEPSATSSPASSSQSSHHSRRDASYKSVPMEPIAQPPAPVASSPIVVVSSLALYFVVSLSIVYFNWWLFTSVFQYPVFVSWVQQVFGLCLFTLISCLGRSSAMFRHAQFRAPEWEVAKRVLPLSLSFTASVGLSNMCLKFVQVSTYQVARSLTLLFTLAFSYFMLGETQAYKTVLASIVMVVGFIVGSLDTSTLSFAGVLAGAFSSAFQAFYNVTVKRVLPHTADDPNLLLYYNLWWSSFLFIPTIFILGEHGVFSILHWNPFSAGYFQQWGPLFFSGVLATMMNLASYWCIKVTSPLTFNVVGITKSIVQSLGGIVILGDLVSAKSLSGIVLSLGGSGWYSYIKVSAQSSASKGKAAESRVEMLPQSTSSEDLRKDVDEESALVNREKQQPQPEAAVDDITTEFNSNSRSPLSEEESNSDA